MNKRKPPSTNAPSLLLTIPQAAEALSVGRNKIYELIKREGLPTVTIGGMMRIPVHSLQAWIEEQEQKS